MIIPDKTIAYYPLIPDHGLETFDMNVDSFLQPLNKNYKRDWFTPHFYKCLPLSIGNMQGFAFSVPFTFNVFWTGGTNIEDVIIEIFNDADKDYTKMNHVSVKSEFGNGIFTVHFPIVLKTPPGINLMTIAAPNYPLPGISPMSGVVETDNLKFTFTLNFKIDLPETNITINKNYPIMGILPIPRYFCDSFSLVNAYNIINNDIIEKERQEIFEMNKERAGQNYNNDKSKKRYYRGVDFYDNEFKDHQLPRKKK